MNEEEERQEAMANLRHKGRQEEKLDGYDSQRWRPREPNKKEKPKPLIKPF